MTPNKGATNDYRAWGVKILHLRHNENGGGDDDNDNCMEDGRTNRQSFCGRLSFVFEQKVCRNKLSMVSMIPDSRRK